MKGICLLGALCLAGLGTFAESARAAEPIQIQTTRAVQSAELKIVKLGKIGTLKSNQVGANQSIAVVGASRMEPSRQATISALRLTLGTNADLKETYRVTPRTLYDPHIGVMLRCWSSAATYTYGNANYWHCESGNNNKLEFDFRQLAPNSTYLVTLDFLFLGSVDVRTIADGQEHVSTISNPAVPLMLVFQTGAGQTTASVHFEKVRGSAYGSYGSFYSLELSRVQ